MFLSRIIEQESDKLGRWIWVKIQRTQKLTTRIVQLYYPHEKYGLYTSATQQYQEIIKNDPLYAGNVREKFEEYLHAMLDKNTADDVINMGDFNVTTENIFIQRLLEKYTLVDVVTHNLPPVEAIKSTYKWVKNRVDQVLASATLLPDISDVNIGTYDELCSEHLPIIFKLNWHEHTEDKQRERHFKKEQFRKGKFLRKRVWERCNKCKIFKSANEIKSKLIALTKREAKKLQRCDTLFTKIAIKAEKKNIPHSCPLSPTIHRAWKEVILYIQWFEHIEDTPEDDFSDSLKALSKKLEVYLVKNVSAANVKKKRNQAIKNIRSLREEGKKHRDQYFDEAAEVAMLTSDIKKEAILRNLRYL